MEEKLEETRVFVSLIKQHVNHIRYERQLKVSRVGESRNQMGGGREEGQGTIWGYTTSFFFSNFLESLVRESPWDTFRKWGKVMNICISSRRSEEGK